MLGKYRFLWAAVPFAAAVGVARAEPQKNEPAATPLPVTAPEVHAHRYTLAECLSLAERNHPNLWAARARLALVHAQLDEATWTPWFTGWSVQSNFGVLPEINGTSYFTTSSIFTKNISGLGGLQPFFSLDFSGSIPLWTFGKISSIQHAAEANVRVSEWDLEKNRQSIRMDVRRAYYGLQLARDSKFIIDDGLKRIDKAVEGIKEKKSKAVDKGENELQRLRMEEFREELSARSGEPQRGEIFALAALRFMTGVQRDFDIIDEPLRRPDRPLAMLTQYEAAARLFRPDVNQARAGLVARRAQVDYNRARFFPDFGLGFGASYAVAPSATPQVTAWGGGDPFNHWGYYFAFGMRWNLDLLPNAARVAEAESAEEEMHALERLALGGAMVEVESAYGTAVEAQTREAAWDRAEHKAKQWISTVQDMVDLGTKEDSAMLDPIRIYGNARIAHMQALMDLDIAMANLAFVSGWDAAAPSR